MPLPQSKPLSSLLRTTTLAFTGFPTSTPTLLSAFYHSAGRWSVEWKPSIKWFLLISKIKFKLLTSAYKALIDLSLVYASNLSCSHFPPCLLSSGHTGFLSVPGHAKLIPALRSPVISSAWSAPPSVLCLAGISVQNFIWLWITENSDNVTLTHARVLVCLFVLSQVWKTVALAICSKTS